MYVLSSYLTFYRYTRIFNGQRYAYTVG